MSKKDNDQQKGDDQQKPKGDKVEAGIAPVAGNVDGNTTGGTVRNDANAEDANNDKTVGDENDAVDNDVPAGNSEEPMNPFDPGALRLEGTDELVVRQELTIVPCKKPNAHAFVRVHPDADYCVETALFEDKLEREMYLVDRSLWGILGKDIKPTALFTAVDRQGNVSLWPVKLPGQARTNAWNESAMAAAQIAKTKWVRVSSNMDSGMYDTHVAQGEIPEPIWPDKTLSELLQLCFQSRLIDSVGHPILQRLRGEL